MRRNELTQFLNSEILIPPSGNPRRTGTVQSMRSPAPAATSLTPRRIFTSLSPITSNPIFTATTSGYFTLPPLRCAIDVIGVDRLLFSVDYGRVIVPFPCSPSFGGDYFQTSRLKVTNLDGRASRHSLARSGIALGTKRESFLQVLDKDANFGGHPTTGRPHGKDWHCSFKRSEKTQNSTFSEFCGKEPCRRLGNPQMFKDTHPHLFNIADAPLRRAARYQ
jgi:hypothetical protein